MSNKSGWLQSAVISPKNYVFMFMKTLCEGFGCSQKLTQFGVDELKIELAVSFVVDFAVVMHKQRPQSVDSVLLKIALLLLYLFVVILLKLFV